MPGKKTDKTRKPARPAFTEVTAAGGMNSGSLFSDSAMEATPQNIKKWRAFTRDYQVGSTWQQRRLSVLAVDWEVTPGGESAADIEAADHLKQQLHKAGFNKAFSKMHWGLFFGFSVAEMIWARDGNRIVIDAIRVRAPERFRFDGRTGQLTFAGGGNAQGEALPDNKMWLYTVDGDSDDAPHGPPLGWQLYWPMFLKENGATFWAVAMEKFGMPTAVGKHPQGASSEDVSNLIQSLLAVHGSAAVAFPDGFEAQLLEATRTSGGQYEVFQDYWDKAVSKIIVGQTMTTDDGSSKSQADVHQDVLNIIVQADADDICNSFNAGPVRWLTQWNFPTAQIPTVERRIKKAEDLGARAERDKALAEGADARLTTEYVTETYGVDLAAKAPPTDTGEAPNGDARFSVANAPANAPADAPANAGFAMANAMAFADPDEMSVLAEQLDEVTAPQLEAMFAEVRAILDTSRSMDEFQQRLLVFAAEQDNADLAELIAGGTTVARLTGQLENA